MDGLLYGVVCWFVLGYRPGTDPDADNISKAVWDVLGDPKPNDQAGRRRLGAYADDKQVRWRLASIFDLNARRLGRRHSVNWT
jgi:Holliday junction resolvase RusA-like endonuclease